MAIYACYYSMIPLPLTDEKTAEKKPAPGRINAHYSVADNAQYPVAEPVEATIHQRHS